MATVFERIDDRLAAFIAAQHLFFVASAPSGGDGHVNLSPKGLDTFAILDPRTVAYLDLTGSGAETVAHVRQNGRITLMFCAFEGPPKIVRLQGRGEVLEPAHAAFGALRPRFPALLAARAIIRVRLDRIADSCGFGIPRYRYEGERTQLQAWAARQGDEGIAAYQAKHNRRSIDGLPALEGGAAAAPPPDGP